MDKKSFAPAVSGGHAEAVEVCNVSRMLCISGQTPEHEDGSLPDSFQVQCRNSWQKVELRLNDANMSLENLVQVRIYLADRKFAGENRKLRRIVLGHHTPALAVVVVGLLDKRWMIEIEALAVA